MKTIYKTIPINGDFISFAIAQTNANSWNCEMFLPKPKDHHNSLLNKFSDIKEGIADYITFSAADESEIYEKINTLLMNVFGNAFCINFPYKD